MRKSVRLAPHALSAVCVPARGKMAGRKRSSGVPTAKITKYFCSEVASGSDSTMVGGSRCSTETEISRESGETFMRTRV